MSSTDFYTALRKRLRIRSVISVNYHYITDINKYILHVLSIKLRDKLFFYFQYLPQVSPIFTIYVRCKSGVSFIRRSFRDVCHDLSPIKNMALCNNLKMRNILNEKDRFCWEITRSFFMETCQIEIKFGFWKNFVVFSLLVSDFRAVWWRKDSHLQFR